MDRERRLNAAPSSGRRALAVAVLCAACGPVSAQAIDYRSAGSGLIARDAPSSEGRQLFRLLAGTPVEVVISQNGWVRIRDPEGSLTWVEQQALSTRRTVIVTAERAIIRREPRESAPPAFEATRQVVLELVEPPTLGWARVRHAQGLEGHVRASEVWGL